MKKILRNSILIVFFILAIFILNDNSSMAKYVINQSKTIKPDIQIDINDPTAFITEWTITSNNTTITLPITTTPNITIDWGDGNREKVTTTKPTHTYLSAGTYDISITGNLPNWNFKSVTASKDYITGIKQWGEVGFTTMEGAFYNCSKITSNIPEPTENSFKDVTSFSKAFYNCGLASIPENLFSNCQNVTSFQSTFSSCSRLTSIPENLFSNCPNVTSFQTTFASCSRLTSIPEGLFKNNTKVTTFNATFSNCSGLTGSIPEKLFFNCPNVTNFTSTFYYCSKLIGNIPANLFINCSNVTNFSTTFRECFKLSGSIPENLFSSCTKVTSFDGTFYNCSSLTGSIPENLFSNCTKVTSFDSTFYYCTGLTGSIPANLFTNCPNAFTFSRTFGSCRGLTSIPTNLFANCRNANYFTSTFSGCSNITSVSINTNKIGDDMFNNCNKLTNITIGDNVTSIGTKAFYISSNLATTLITDNDVAINYNWASDNRTITRPDSVLNNKISAGNNTYYLPFIFSSVGDRLSQATLTQEFSKAGLSIKSITPTTLGTGTTITTNENSKTYQILIYGDVNGDGRIGLPDAQTIIDKCNNGSQFSGVYFLASNVNNSDNVIDNNDAQRIIDFYLESVDTILATSPKTISLTNTNNVIINNNSSEISLEEIQNENKSNQDKEKITNNKTAQKEEKQEEILDIKESNILEDTATSIENKANNDNIQIQEEPTEIKETLNEEKTENQKQEELDKETILYIEEQEVNRG